MSDWSNQARKYLHYETNEEHKSYVQKLIDSFDSSCVNEKDEDELKRLFARRLVFGTAGIRGRMGPGYAQMNDLVIIQTSQGLASYLLEYRGERLCKERGVIIGHDARHNSARFAKLAALAFLQRSIPVHFCDQIIPTPFVAFGVKQFNCICGIMITASHNPKQDNGYKVYWSNGAQILSPHDKNIQRHIEQNQQPWPKAWQHETIDSAFDRPAHKQTKTTQLDTDKLQFSSSARDFEGLLFYNYEELNKCYFAYIQQLVGEHFEKNQSASLRITYTTMHGVGHSFLSRALSIAGFDGNNSFPVETQREPDPDFPTVKFPNPEEAGALDLAFETAARTNSTLILANDPDADRCAAALYEPIERKKRVLTGNEIGSLLCWWIWRNYQERANKQAGAAAAGGGSASEKGPLDHARTGAQTIVHTANKPSDATAMAAAARQSHWAADEESSGFKKARDCYMLSTAVSSRFLRSMAQVEGFQFVETLTGFKYMGNVAHDLIHKQRKCVLFAYEEAIGYMVDTQILDKDGISAAVQLAQCAAYLKRVHNRTLEGQLAWLYARYGYHFSINSYYLCHEPKTIATIFNQLQSNYPKGFGLVSGSGREQEFEFSITRVRDLNNGLDSGSPDHRATLPTSSSSFMVTFFIGHEIQFTIRTSGTEPKIKYYSEIVATLPSRKEDCIAGETLELAQERAKRAAQEKLKRFVEVAVERCLKPSQYNLEPAASD